MLVCCLVVVAGPGKQDAFEEAAVLVVWRFGRGWSPERQKQVGCGERVSVLFFVDGGAAP